ncbi:MAG: response regulator, partial [Candidatus Omnitrophica bacterium]|nr:response regulator [Candidatus Omnitrophota bacterium]
MARKSKIRKILVVDDDRTITVLIKKYLEKNGYEVTAINEASEGLEFAMTRKPDLIILDVMMPIING